MNGLISASNFKSSSRLLDKQLRIQQEKKGELKIMRLSSSTIRNFKCIRTCFLFAYISSLRIYTLFHSTVNAISLTRRSRLKVQKP